MLLGETQEEEKHSQIAVATREPTTAKSHAAVRATGEDDVGAAAADDQTLFPDKRRNKEGGIHKYRTNMTSLLPRLVNLKKM